MTGAEMVVKTLEKNGVKVVFVIRVQLTVLL